MGNNRFTFTTKRTSFDEHYCPAENTRITTNFANLARGSSRQENLRNTLQMINNRFNSLACWDNPSGDRYSISLDIISVELTIDIACVRDDFPLIEMLQTRIYDKEADEWLTGIVGNNFSSYVRDYDFSIVLPEHIETKSQGLPKDFGSLHGKLFKSFLASQSYKENFEKPPVICLSVSSSRTYHRIGNVHPVLGVEYQQNDFSLTDEYFARMGLNVRYFMPANSVAPLAFYFHGDLLRDYTNLELVSTISTMETFQKIYRPEIYNSNSSAAEIFQPSLKHQDYSLTRIVYDREERSQLAVEQGRFAQEHFIKPYGAVLEQWSAAQAN